MKILLHIGGEKTGTTALQNHLAANREYLLDKRVLYPRTLGERNHVKAYVFAAEAAVDELTGQLDVIDDASRARFRNEIARDLKREVEAAQPDLLIVSNEHLSSRLRAKNEIARLIELLRSTGDVGEIEVLYYARSQVELLPSLYSTFVKAGGTDPFKYPLDNPDLEWKLNHLGIARLWLDALDGARWSARSYGLAGSTGDDIVGDMERCAGSSLGVRLEGRANASLSSEALEFLRVINAYLPRTVGHKFNPERGNIQQLLEKVPGPLLALPLSLSAKILADYRESNRAFNELVGKPVLPDDPDAAGPEDLDACDEAVTISEEISVDRCARIFADLFAAKQRQVLDSRGRIAKLQARRNG